MTVLMIFEYYLEIPIYFILSLLICFLFHLFAKSLSTVGVKNLLLQALVICGIMTGMLSIPLFVYIGLQCLIHSSLGFIMGMLALYFLRPNHYHL